MDVSNYLRYGDNKPCHACGETGFQEVEAFFAARKLLSVGMPRVLDIGAGNRINGQKIAALGYRLTYLDLHPQDVDVVFGEMHALPLNDSCYDFVLSNHTFEHSVAPLVALSEIHRVLVPDGFAVIVVPDWQVDSWYGEKSHVGLIHERLFRHLCSVVGFEIEVKKDLLDSSVMWVLKKVGKNG